jgi:tetratricopeptide (TPR) repeat protein
MPAAKRKWILTAAMAVLIGAATPGCQSNRKQEPSQKEQATKQWNDARAGVLGSLAQDQYKNGDFEKCEETLTEALRLAPDNTDLHLLAARLSIEQGKLEAAEAQLDVARKLSPKNAEVDYLAGIVLQRWQQPLKAYEAYDTAVQKNPQELAYLMAKSEMLVVLHRQDEALQVLKEKVVYFEHSAAIRDAVGQLLVEQAKYADGADMLREASILATDDQIIREHLAFAQFDAKEYRDAIETFNRLLKDEKFQKRADIFAAMGECQANVGQLRDARESFETATNLDSSTAGYWLGLGRVAAQLGDLQRGELAARKALAIEPANGSAHCLLGYVRLREGKLPAALAAFRMASQLDAADTLSLTMQGYVLEKLGKRDEAVQFYARALKIKPNDELASRLMASVSANE